MRRVLHREGYAIVNSNVRDVHLVFEDWYIHPEYISRAAGPIRPPTAAPSSSPEAPVPVYSVLRSLQPFLFRTHDLLHTDILDLLYFDEQGG